MTASRRVEKCDAGCRSARGGATSPNQERWGFGEFPPYDSHSAPARNAGAPV